MISLTVVLKVDPARVEEFLDAMGENAAASRREPGCRGFEIHAGLGAPDEFVLWELYDDEAALQAHHASPHFARWKQRSAGGMVVEKRSWRCERVAPRPEA